MPILRLRFTSLSQVDNFSNKNLISIRMSKAIVIPSSPRDRLKAYYVLSRPSEASGEIYNSSLKKD